MESFFTSSIDPKVDVGSCMFTIVSFVTGVIGEPTARSLLEATQSSCSVFQTDLIEIFEQKCSLDSPKTE